MATKTLNWKNYHHQIYQLYHGTIALNLVPFCLFFLEWDTGFEKTIVSYSSPFFILIAQLIWVIGYASWYVWKGEKVSYVINDKMTADEKLNEFKKKNLYKYFILAGAGLISVLAMWIQPSFLFVLAYFGVLIQYSFLRPSEDKIVRDMGLSKADRQKLHDTA
ncbi:hypothetical protein [Ekhidna sp.]|uniref:hypothetical protein n=1 Tax=Ekhidna sp. TaxID=2608089 RepID=UPI003296D563